MKKIIGFGFIIGFVLMLCGCGNSSEKILECSIDNSNYSGLDTTTTVKAVFFKNNVTNVSTETIVSIDEEYLPYMVTLVNSFKETLDSEKYKKNGISTEISNDEKFIYYVINYDLEKISDTDKEELDLTGTYGTYEATRDEMINQGYTCK